MSEIDLIFLKLGGSLITDKAKPHTLRPELLHRLADEIKKACQEKPSLKIVLGHGSGSFGHVPAKKYNTVEGVHASSDRAGFMEVWREARDLNNLVIKEFTAVKLPILCFPPSACVQTADRKIIRWDIKVIETALKEDYIPLLYGDVILDAKICGTILSTEELFSFLVKPLIPSRILLAGIDDGVFSDFPKNKSLIPMLTPTLYAQHIKSISPSRHIDVTGGMSEKVRLMIELVKDHPGLSISVFSGLKDGNVYKALMGEYPGTTIRALEKNQ